MVSSRCANDATPTPLRLDSDSTQHLHSLPPTQVGFSTLNGTLLKGSALQVGHDFHKKHLPGLKAGNPVHLAHSFLRTKYIKATAELPGKHLAATPALTHTHFNPSPFFVVLVVQAYINNNHLKGKRRGRPPTPNRSSSGLPKCAH